MTRILLFVIAILVSVSFYLHRKNETEPRKIFPSSSMAVTPGKKKVSLHIKTKALELKLYALKQHYSTAYCFLADMSLPSGINRFFIYDLEKDSVVAAGLIAHGSCNNYFLENVSFSNETGCGCSAAGKYRVGYQYEGRFGKAFKLYGLDKSNSNAFDRNIVLHSYQCVPDEEVYPQPICNSLGCAMVSPGFIKLVSKYINGSSKPVLLYIFK
jgi:hypothetical protein